MVLHFYSPCADSPYLFISNRGIPLERRSYWDLMQKYGKGADMPKAKRRFHALRHAIAVHHTTVTREAQTRQLFASHHVV